jgi:ceramide glucosyltransferase
LHLRKPATDLPAPGYAYHAPLRDCLLLLIWFSAFLGTTTRWREQTVRIDDPAEPIG